MRPQLTARCAALVVAAMLALSAGCTTIQAARGGPGQRLDPWENWNRKVFAFNEELDARLLKPVATVYTDIVPQPVRNAVGNFFGNVQDAWSAINNLLQGKFTPGMQDLMRVGTNTVFGLFGAIDVATEMGWSDARPLGRRSRGLRDAAGLRPVDGA
jgi:phospholipid-binding lipoprotein MlaA